MMARTPRIAIPLYPHHVIQRGNNRQKIFFAEADYSFFLDCLEKSKTKYACRIYAYVLMPNHIHLLVEPADEKGLGQLMQSLGRRYVSYINKTYKRSGTLWEGRFKSAVVSRDEYLIRCSRYIEMNPVRAGIVKKPEEYRWSSFRTRAFGQSNNLLEEDPWYIGLGETTEERQKVYRDWVKSTVGNRELDQIRKETTRGRLIGPEEFKKEIETAIGRRVIGELRGRPRKQKSKKYSDPNFLVDFFEEMPIEPIIQRKGTYEDEK